jgi:RNA recognition motif-containing protein
MNIFVARLSYSTTDEQLQRLFENFGTVDSVKIIQDRIEGKSKGYGFVEMPNEEEGKRAIENLNDSEVDGRRIVVKVSQPRDSGRGPQYGNRY